VKEGNHDSVTAPELAKPVAAVESEVNVQAVQMKRPWPGVRSHQPEPERLISLMACDLAERERFELSIQV